jgi:hypothetical protein
MGQALGTIRGKLRERRSGPVANRTDAMSETAGYLFCGVLAALPVLFVLLSVLAIVFYFLKRN